MKLPSKGGLFTPEEFFDTLWGVMMDDWGYTFDYSTYSRIHAYHTMRDYSLGCSSKNLICSFTLNGIKVTSYLFAYSESHLVCFLNKVGAVKSVVQRMARGVCKTELVKAYPKMLREADKAFSDLVYHTLRKNAKEYLREYIETKINENSKR